MDSKDDTEYTERALRQWLSDLPLGHVGKTAKQLYDKLGDLGNSSVPPTLRWKALRVMAPVVDDVFSTLQSHYISAVPKPEDHRIARLAQAFHARMEVIAIQVAASPGRTPRGFGARNQVQRAYASALRSIGARALIDYQRYTTPNPDLWKSLHRVYRQAGGSHSANDVRRAYLAPICLAAGNPLRLRPSESQQCLKQLLTCKIERYVTLTPAADHEHQTDVETDATWKVTDTGLRYVADGDHRGGYLLDLRDLAEAWPRIAGRNANAELRQRLVEEWVRKSRCDLRQPVANAGALPIVIGFAAVYQRVAEACAEPTKATKPREIDPARAWARLTDAFKPEAPLAARLIEQGEGGCRIRLTAQGENQPGATPTPVNGDLIAIEFEPGQWRPAFVRWHQRNDQGWDAGLENAGQAAATALVQHPDGCVRAIVTRGDDGLQRALIETQHADRASQGIGVRINGTEQEAAIVTGRLETGNPAVMIFELGDPPLKPTAAPVPVGPRKAGPRTVSAAIAIDEFKAVWESL